jgi:hypothetical protein
MEKLQQVEHLFPNRSLIGSGALSQPFHPIRWNIFHHKAGKLNMNVPFFRPCFLPPAPPVPPFPVV